MDTERPRDEDEQDEFERMPMTLRDARDWYEYALTNLGDDRQGGDE